MTTTTILGSGIIGVSTACFLSEAQPVIHWLFEHPAAAKSMKRKDIMIHAVFTSDEDGYSLEIFSKIGGESYVAGLKHRSTKSTNGFHN